MRHAQDLDGPERGTLREARDDLLFAKASAILFTSKIIYFRGEEKPSMSLFSGAVTRGVTHAVLERRDVSDPHSLQLGLPCLPYFLLTDPSTVDACAFLTSGVFPLFLFIRV